MNYSRQRELIFQVLSQSSLSHPTADDIYHVVHGRDANISLATVYRNLNQLAEQGMLRKVRVANAPDHFDIRCDDHPHALCTKCGAVQDISLPSLERLFQEVQTLTDFSAADCQVMITGTCSDCDKKNRTTKKEGL